MLDTFSVKLALGRVRERHCGLEHVLNLIPERANGQIGRIGSNHDKVIKERGRICLGRWLLDSEQFYKGTPRLNTRIAVGVLPQKRPWSALVAL